MLKNRSLKVKLVYLSIFLSSLTVAVGTLSLFLSTHMSDEYSEVVTVSVPKSEAILGMIGEARRLRIDLRTLAIEEFGAAEIERARGAAQAAMDDYDKLERAYLALPVFPGEQVLIDGFLARGKEFRELARTMIELSRAKDEESRALFIATFPREAEIGADWRKALIDAKVFQENLSKQFVENAEQTEHVGNAVIAILALLAFVVGLVVALKFAGSLSKALQALATELSSGADEVASAATQISSTSVELSAAATEQASSLQETAASVEEMSAMVKKNAENAMRSTEVAESGRHSAQSGKRAVDQMVSAIGDISESNTEIMKQIEESNARITEITRVIAEIGDKTKVINDIVFQTKLLSFNASVEAARAGEHGKGFAVVAEEVGNLAQMSGNAAKEIADMLASSIEKVEGIVADTKSRVEGLISKAKSKVQVGTSVAEQCRGALDELVGHVEIVAKMVGEITNASQEQAQGVQEITKAMGQLDQVTQQNASASHQSATAAEQLARQAESLRASVHGLIRTVKGGEESNVPHVAPHDKGNDRLLTGAPEAAAS